MVHQSSIAVRRWRRNEWTLYFGHSYTHLFQVEHRYYHGRTNTDAMSYRNTDWPIDDPGLFEAGRNENTDQHNNEYNSLSGELCPECRPQFGYAKQSLPHDCCDAALAGDAVGFPWQYLSTRDRTIRCHY
jgi:hypothetical protein